MEERNQRKVRAGVVVSDKMDKTVVVAVLDKIKHPIYKKTMNKTKKYKVHDEKNEAGSFQGQVFPSRAHRGESKVRRTDHDTTADIS